MVSQGVNTAPPNVLALAAVGLKVAGRVIFMRLYTPAPKPLKATPVINTIPGGGRFA